jgi:hypothetical protein
MKKLLLFFILVVGLCADIMYYNEPIKTEGNTESGHIISVHVEDVHHIPINSFVHLDTNITSTIAVSAVSAGDTSIEIADATSFTVGDYIKVSNSSLERTFQRITAKATNVLTLDMPIDGDYEIGDSVIVVQKDLSATAGSLGSPIAYRLHPDPGEIWHIVRFMISMVHTAAADDSKFGDIAALANGVVFRAYNGTAGKYRTFTNWKSNADMKLDFFDLTYTDKAGGGKFGVNGRASINIGSGAVPRLSAEAGDYIEILIQDNLTALDSFGIKFQAHLAEC